ncbi:hypothetical protein KGD82_27595 (plasmid) [Nocardiopsis eucommiae]|uniref:Uncharacterized protein n=1 Tax=Nocardiopsis eucommiae TaxID=2831970 RepID=A0A975QMJ0_9ACTN|nr:hypothetical protein KGD82_27595 [Nocardiopsis eucommiae]
MHNHAPAPDLDAVIRRALERARADLPPEGATVQISDETTMREELHGMTVDEAVRGQLTALPPPGAHPRG